MPADPLEDRTCSTPVCPGDGRYVPPGRGHLPDCRHLSRLQPFETLLDHATRNDALSEQMGMDVYETPLMPRDACLIGAFAHGSYLIDLDPEDPPPAAHHHRPRLGGPPVTCPATSPESVSACVLPDNRDAHMAGHESARIDGVRAVWATTSEETRPLGRRHHRKRDPLVIRRLFRALTNIARPTSHPVYRTEFGGTQVNYTRGGHVMVTPSRPVSERPIPEPPRPMTGTERVRAAVERDRGMAHAPDHPVLFSGDDHKSRR